MKYAFIDYENIHSLDNIQLNEYEKVYLFLGAQQQSITLSEKFNDQVIIHLITVKEVAKNNLDFHLAYFLGKFDQEIDKKVNFDVISRDKGYQGICDYIQNQKNARRCSLISLTTEAQKEESDGNKALIISKQDIEKYAHDYRTFMLKTEIRHLPTSVEKLSNHICSQTNLKNLPQRVIKIVIPKIITLLSENQLITIKNNTIQYQLSNSVKLYTEYEHFLLKREKLKRPQKISSLKNEIASKLKLHGDTEKINEIINLLQKNGIFSYSTNTETNELIYKK